MSMLESLLSLLDVSNVLIFLLVLLVTYVYLHWMRVNKMPPGPTGIPFLGYVPFMDKSRPFWQVSQDIAKRYNSDITSMNFLGTMAIFLTSREATREAFHKRQDMADRPKAMFFKTLDPSHDGLLMSSGALWKEHRRFALLMLRDFGMGKIAAEENIRDEAVTLCQHFQKLGKDTEINPIQLLEPAVSNIICAIGFGKRFSYDDPKFMDTLNAMNFFVSPAISLYIRIVLSKTLGRLGPYLYPGIAQPSQRNYNLMSEFIYGVIDEHKKSFDGNVNDLIDGFLLEQTKRTGTEHTFTDQQLRHVIFDLFLAGSETTTTTLRWALLYLINYPDIQERIYHEILSVIGSERVPNMSDRKFTPYTEAFLLENQRFNTIVPTSIVHSCSEDIQFMGYLIPANAVVFSNLAAIHRDPREFPDPDIFRPERFLDGDKVINADKLDQFGIGRRICVGEALARMEIYIFFTTMVQRLKFVSANQELDLICDKHGNIQCPKPFTLHAISRSETK